MPKNDVTDPGKESFDASCLILGFTGSLGSGCTFLAEGVADVLGEHGHYYRVSDHLKEVAEEREVKPTVANLQNIGDELRRDHGLYILVQKSIERVKKDVAEDVFSQEEETVILIDGIKNEGEIRYLKQFPNFYMISVHADRPLREKRIVGEAALLQRFDTPEDFQKADNRDAEEDIPHGQQIKKCNYLNDTLSHISH